ncbi:unnamed protein product [Meganyctiphanes norvegica]|uniref:Heparan-alpha-glucosaminide N-acetyltransferase catalytic domain-containing protein n=1 Tax=Meganyctiphanes norvegica TaxID=48144 RepID=A0AAV2QWZ0_MEGNR
MGGGCAFTEDPGAEEFQGLNLNELGVDEAYLRVTSNYTEDLYLYTRSGDCYGCPLSYRQDIIDGQVNCSENAACEIETAHPWTFFVTTEKKSFLNESHDPVCSLSNERLGEFGVYDLMIDSEGQCQLKTAKEPVYEYGALIIFLAVYVGLALLVWLVEYGRRKEFFEKLTRKLHDSETNLEMSSPPAEDKPPVKRPRVKSLDTFRGISIMLMVFVNYGGGHYWFMEHATWNGLQVADLVFPWFMWIMGVCIPMGLRSQLKRNVPWFVILQRVFKRSLKLFMLGLLQNSLGSPWSGPVMETFRIPGVLQRFAICYLLVTAIALAFTPRKPDSMSHGMLLMYEAAQWGVHLAIVITHTCITFLMPVPDCPTGYLGPGGLHLIQNGEPSPQCIGGAAGEVDRWILTSDHIYQNPTAKFTYSSGAFDPEGILGTMLSVFQVFLGLQAGLILQKYSEHKDRVIRWAIWGAATGILGTILCFGTMNDGPIPVNKNLWSLSYVMVTSSFAFFLLAACYLLIDVWNVWNGSPCYQAGMNSIFMYMGHNVAYSLFPWHWSIGPMRTHLVLLGECLWGVSLWVITALYLHSIGKFYAV